MRALLRPNRVGNQSEFFLHLDVTADPTAGCIGINPADEGKFNYTMTMIARMPKKHPSLLAIVDYPD